MSTNATTQFLQTLGQALAAYALYGEGHPMRASVSERAHRTLLSVLEDRGALRVSFLGPTVIVGTRVMQELRGWEWCTRFASAGVGRLEIDLVPATTLADMELLLSELQQRLQPGADVTSTVALRSFRFGPIAVATGSDEHTAAADALLDSLAVRSMAEELSAVRWIHDEITAGRDMPLAEVEAVVHSLAMAVHHERQLLLPLLDIDHLDEYRTAHSCNVAILSLALGEQIGLSASDARAIGSAALLYDIGMTRVPAELRAAARALTPEEMTRMQAHTVEGARLLSARSPSDSLAITVAYEHHLWDNGQGGYPHLQWPRRAHLASRIVHICDVYDAMCTPRPYRAASTRVQAIAWLRERSYVEFDAELVQAFVTLLERAAESRSVVEADVVSA